MEDREKIELALDKLSCMDMDYNEWLAIGMVCKDVGLPLSSWDGWSRTDPARYRTGECQRKWQGFGSSARRVSVGTVVEICRAHHVELGGGSPSSEPDEPLDIDGEIPDLPPPSWARERVSDDISDYIEVEAPKVIREEYVADERITVPGDGWRRVDDLRRYIQALFREGDVIGICTSSFERGGKWYPSDSGAYHFSVLMRDINGPRGKEDDIESVVAAYNHEAGAWVRINPCTGSFNKDVQSFRHSLVECDNMPPERQLALIRELRLPCAAIVHSGGKSIHAIVRIDASGEDEYRQRVDRLFAICKRNGLQLDSKNRNPSRYTRLPGFDRGDGKQFLIDTDCGMKSWQEWIDFIEESTDDLPDIEDTSIYEASMPEQDDVIIEGLLTRGDKMMVSGPSKAGKSFLLMELAVSIATGGEWLGQRCRKGRVLYLNMELKRSRFAERLAKILQETGEGWPKGIDVWHLRGRNTSLQSLAPKLSRRCRGKGYDVIIVDPLYKVFTGDENKASEVSEMCNLVDFVARDNEVAIVYCHHHSKGEQLAKKAEDRASGSGVFARDADAIVDITSVTLKEEMVAELKREIGRDGDLTAWVSSTVIRNFPSIPERIIAFSFPLHYVSSMPVPWRRQTTPAAKPEKRQEDKEKEDMELVKSVDYVTAYHTLRKQGQVTVDQLAAEMRKSPITIKRYFASHPEHKMHIDKGVISHE